MILDSILQALVPKDKKFFTLFKAAADNLKNASDLLVKVSDTQPGELREALIREIDDLEHKGDKLTHDIFLELNTNFITPLDRTDIIDLAKSLDDVLDHINLSAYCLNMYNLVSPPPEYGPLVRNIALSAELIRQAVGLLENRKAVKAVQELCVRINSLENEADGIFVTGMSRLFREEKDPINLIRQKETLIALELATDMAEDVANVLDTITIKIA
jgi:predicted phosphate transport protein (TIGR00153 family)